MATFTVKRGDTWVQAFDYKQESETGDPVNLTHCSARLQVRAQSGVLALDCTDALTIDAVAGRVSVRKLVPATIPIGQYVFDLEMTFSDGRVQSTVTQTLKILPDVTYG